MTRTRVRLEPSRFRRQSPGQPVRPSTRENGTMSATRRNIPTPKAEGFRVSDQLGSVGDPARTRQRNSPQPPTAAHSVPTITTGAPPCITRPFRPVKDSGGPSHTHTINHTTSTTQARSKRFFWRDAGTPAPDGSLIAVSDHGLTVATGAPIQHDQTRARRP